MYPHMFLMPSGKIFMQANTSTILWNYTSNVETPLPDMPNREFPPLYACCLRKGRGSVRCGAKER